MGGGGQGTFWSSCHILHYHMVLRPEGTSHNNRYAQHTGVGYHWFKAPHHQKTVGVRLMHVPTMRQEQGTNDDVVHGTPSVKSVKRGL